MAIKRFKAYISEESTGEKLEPKAQGEKDFKAKHSIETTKHPVAGDHQFNGDRAEITEDTLVDMDKSSADMVQKLAKKLKLNVKVTKNKHGLSDVEVTGSSADMKKFMNSLPQENVQEGKVKDQMIDDSETMSKKDFIKKYGKEYADDLYEGKVKDQMIKDSEKMSKKDFIKKYGKENADDLYEDEDEDEDDEEESNLEESSLVEGAVVDQLKAIISKKSAKPVKFGNGKVEEIDMTTAAALVNMLEKLKPANKVKAEKMLEKSPEGMFQLLDVAFGGK